MSFGFTTGASAGQVFGFYKGGIDAKTTGATTILTTSSAGNKLIVFDVWYMWETVDGWASNPTSITVGSNSATFDDIIPGGSFGTVATTYLPVKQAISGASQTSKTVDASTALKINIGSAGTGTTLTMAVFGFAMYLP